MNCPLYRDLLYCIMEQLFLFKLFKQMYEDHPLFSIKGDADYASVRLVSRLWQEAVDQVYTCSFSRLMAKQVLEHPIAFNFLLHRKGVDPTAEGGKLFIKAVSCGYIEPVKSMLVFGVDPSSQIFGHSNEPVLKACQGGHLDIVQLLLSDERVRSTVDLSALRGEANSRAQPKVLNFLLQCNHDISEEEERGLILEAYQSQYLSCLKVIIRNSTKHHRDPKIQKIIKQVQLTPSSSTSPSSGVRVHAETARGTHRGSRR